MSIQPNDPRLTAYVLGELDKDHASEIEAALRESPELEKEVEEIRQASQLLSSGLSVEPEMALSQEDRENIEKAADAPALATNTAGHARRWWLVAVAASVLVVVGVLRYGDQLGNLSDVATNETLNQDKYADEANKSSKDSPSYLVDRSESGGEVVDPNEVTRESTSSGHYDRRHDDALPTETPVIGGELTSGDSSKITDFYDDDDTTVRDANDVSDVRNPHGVSRPHTPFPNEPAAPKADVAGTPAPGNSDSPDIVTTPKPDPVGGGRTGLAEISELTIPEEEKKSEENGRIGSSTTELDSDEGEGQEDLVRIRGGEGKLTGAMDRFNTLMDEDRHRGAEGTAMGLGDIDKVTKELEGFILTGKQTIVEFSDELRGSDEDGEAREELTKGLDDLKTQVAKIEDARRMFEKRAEKIRTTWRRAKATPNASRLMIGDQDELPLEGMQVNVQVDGFRARVLVDYYFYNNRDRQLEGTFKLRLPNEASLYFFAFGETAHEYRPQDENKSVHKSFVSGKDVRRVGAAPDDILLARAETWNKPKVARIVQKEKAAYAYRETVRRKVDPALVEWSGAGVFAARVFPLTSKKLHRIVVGYDVSLTQMGDDLVYDLDLPEGVSNTAVDINVAAVAGTKATITPQVKPFTSNGRAYYNITDLSDRQVKVRVEDVAASLLTGKDKKTGSYFAARFTPELPKDKVSSGSTQAVLLLDTSLSSNPDKFNTYLTLLEALLEKNRDSIKQFAVLTFNIETHWWQEKFVDNDAKNVQKLLDYAHTLSLEGATDLEQALREAATPSWLALGGEIIPWDVFLLSDAGMTWGERNVHLLSKRLSEGHAGALFSYNTGMTGTSVPVMSHLARESGGAVFAITSEAEIAKASRAHRSRPWQLVSVEVDGGTDLLIAGRAKTIYPEQQLTLVGRGSPSEDASIVLKMRRGKQRKTIAVPVDQQITSDLAPRTYGQVAVGQLESLGDFTEQMSVAYARHFRVTGQTCSLLMLETDADYERFNIKSEDDEFVVKSSPAVLVITAAIDKAGDMLSDGKASFTAWLAKMEKMPGVTFNVSPALKVAIDSLPSESFDVSVKPLRCEQRTWGDTSSDLREQLSLGKLDYDALQKEAQRRMSKHSEADALRVLSSLIENSPGNLVLSRDVAYSALEWGLSDQAYHLLRRVSLARPYEPQMYLAMAQSLSDSGHNDLALLYYEVASGGTWDGRFGDFKRITAVDYVHFLRQIASGKRKTRLKDFANARLERLSKEVNLEKSDVLVTIAWNTDGTDVDLHVTEPTGEVCSYEHTKTRIGGQITSDCTQGFGPEMYTLPNARHGKYKIEVKYFAEDSNRIGTRTKVLASIYQGWGTPKERVIRQAVTLSTGKDMHEVTTVGVEK